MGRHGSCPAAGRTWANLGINFSSIHLLFVPLSDAPGHALTLYFISLSGCTDSSSQHTCLTIRLRVASQCRQLILSENHQLCNQLIFSTEFLRSKETAVDEQYLAHTRNRRCLMLFICTCVHEICLVCRATH